MNQTGEHIEAGEQLERARNALGAALGYVQDIHSAGVDVGRVSASLAQAVQKIFAIQRNGVKAASSTQHIQLAMERLRESLALLQDVPVDDPELNRTTTSVAKTLALLYPVSKVLENAVSGKEQPIPLAPRRSANPPPKKSAPSTRKSSPSLRGASPSKVPPGHRTSSERRVGTRRAIDTEIGIHSTTNFFTGFSLDISHGGLFVATYDVLPRGTKINVNFKLPPKGPVLSLDGVVRWVREYNDSVPDIEPGMGVEFENLSAQDRHFINFFMVQHPPIFFDDE